MDLESLFGEFPGTDRSHLEEAFDAALDEVDGDVQEGIRLLRDQLRVFYGGIIDVDEHAVNENFSKEKSDKSIDGNGVAGPRIEQVLQQHLYTCS